MQDKPGPGRAFFWSANCCDKLIFPYIAMNICSKLH